MKMKNGNLKILFSMIALGYVVGSCSAISKNRIQKMSNSNSNQYVNRLKEFFFDDYSKAVKKYSHFIASGLSPQDAFDILVSSIQLTEIPIGEFND